MSPKKCTLSLRSYCIKYISSQLISIVSRCVFSNLVEILRSYYAQANYEVVQDILQCILNALHLDAATRFLCLEVLLRSDVRHLETGTFPQAYYEQVLNSLQNYGCGLQKLNLKGVWARDMPLSLSHMLEKLPKLRVLIIPHMANDSVLEVLENCKDLVYLDISGECCYTSNCLKRLRYQNLNVLDIGSFGKRAVCQNEDQSMDYHLLADILENMPNLFSFGTYSFVGNVLLLLHKKLTSTCNSELKTTKLKYLHDTGTTNEMMDAIINLSPHLESLQIDTPDCNVMCRLSELKELHSLKITKPHISNLKTFCMQSGANIKILKLNHNNYEVVDLSDIALYVPNLVVLQCFQMQLDFTRLDLYFMNLKHIEILYCDVGENFVRTVFTNCPCVTRLTLGCVINMTDGDIFRLCAECALLHLEEIWLASARALTIISVELLIRHCPNLKIIGSLNGWDVQQEEIDYLRHIIHSTNIDITLLPRGSIN